MPFPFIIVSFVPETKNNKTMTTSLDPARPLGSMTIGEFLEMFDEHLHATNLQTAHVQTGATPKHLVYGLRYIKQVKVRIGVNQYDGEKILLFKLQQVRGYTQFVYEDTVCESDHLRPKNAFTEAEDLQELIDLQAQHKTVRQIAEETGSAPKHRPPQTQESRTARLQALIRVTVFCPVPTLRGTSGTRR